eukprot:729165-Amphidinium_carterae.2
MPYTWTEVQSVQQACSHLRHSYECLSTGPRARPLADLQVHGVAFAELLVQLHQTFPDKYSVPAKLHLMMELCMEGSRPSRCWCYREEDFGGFLAGVARRKGGIDSPLATSKNTLQAYCFKQNLPALSA